MLNEQERYEIESKNGHSKTVCAINKRTVDAKENEIS